VYWRGSDDGGAGVVWQCVGVAVARGRRGGVMITASHNPPRYSGIKLKAAYGGSASPEDCKEIEFVEWWPLSHLPIGDSNVDVSIFRTLMRGVTENENEIVDYISSKEAQNRVSQITRNFGKC